MDRLEADEMLRGLEHEYSRACAFARGTVDGQMVAEDVVFVSLGTRCI